MSSEERKKILRMVEEGKISAQDAASLMRALGDGVEKTDAEVEVVYRETGSGFEEAETPEFDQIKARVRRFASIPLWVGIAVTVLSAWIIYAIQKSAGVNFWLYCMIMPLLLGVLLIALGSGGRSSRWVYVDVDRRDAKPGEGPRRIALGFPAPLGLLAWFFNAFGQNIQGMGAGKGRAIAQMFEAAKTSGEPLMVDVNDDDAHVQVYIG
ncbi:MAG TPA: hypothetical protein PLM89_07910 [Anaerolineales bacterium]|nr:hypothetical protein [Anaerolineales bacterium]